MTNSASMADIETCVREYIVGSSTRLPAGGQQLANDYPLLETGLLDSLGIFTLLVHLENTFDVRLNDADLLPQNFATVRDIARLVRKRSGASTE